MAKFLNGSGVQSALTDVITSAKKSLVIISPYLDIPVQTKKYLRSIDKKGVPIVIIYKTNEKITNDDLVFFETLKNLTLGHCENLHAKCYLNEKVGIITSMNLFEYSMTHNWEMGIKFSEEHDPDIFEGVLKELEWLTPQVIKYTVGKGTGYCIRCRKPMEEINLNKPLCKNCFREWAKYNKWQYPEKYCHSCGSDTTKSPISFEKPLCKKCADTQQKK